MILPLLYPLENYSAPDEKNPGHASVKHKDLQLKCTFKRINFPV